MKKFLLCALGLLGCASGGDPPGTTSTDAGPDTRVAADTGAPFPTDGPMDSIFALDDTGPPGICGNPPGTTVTANAAYMSAAEDAIDGKLDSAWNSGNYSGWIELKFPAPTHLDRVRIATHAVPAGDETFTIKLGDKVLATETRAVASESMWLPQLAVPAGTYDSIRIEITSGSSWIAINELKVSESTAECASP